MVLDPVGAGAAQQAAREELRRAEYHRDDPSLVDRVMKWVGHLLSRSFDGTPSGTALLLAMIAVGAVIVVALVRAGPPRREARLDAVDLADPLRPLGAAEHRRRATAFAAEGKRREALREWLRAAVATIEERGVLLPRPGRTGAATAREAGPLLPSAAQRLRAATVAFDEVWFGGREVTDADVATAHQAADQVAAARIASATTPANGYVVPR